MHKTRYNSLRLRLSLRPVGPLLIKSGETSINPSLPDMQFVRTYHPDLGEVVYIPGSSLKGVVRSFVEKVLRTLDTGASPGPSKEKGWRWACATFENRGKDERQWNCTQFIKSLCRDEPLPHEVYSLSCGACRIFGHTRLKGRLSFTDLMPTGDVKTEIRYGVAISRRTHAVAVGPFDMEVAVSGTFVGQLVLENFELWQAGLLVLALESMNKGLIKVGFGKNRGFGEVKVTVDNAMFDELSSGAEETTWRGLGAMVNQKDVELYGLYLPFSVGSLPSPSSSEGVGIYLRRQYGYEVWREVVPRLQGTLMEV